MSVEEALASLGGDGWHDVGWEDEEERDAVLRAVGAFMEAIEQVVTSHNTMIQEVARAHGIDTAPALLLRVPEIVCARV